jgi:8-oxo-dGTP diphosphatase
LEKKSRDRGEEVTIRVFGKKLDDMAYIDRPGAYAVIEKKDKQIAVIETRNGYFLPGGGIDPGETELGALRRELMEEIGYQVSVIEEIGSTIEYIKVSREEKYYQIRSRFYRVQLETKVGEGIESDHRLLWLSQEDALQLLTRQGQVWAVSMRTEA